MTRPGRSSGYRAAVRRRLVLALLIALALPALALAGHQEPKRQLAPADERRAAAIVLRKADFAAGWRKLPSQAQDDSHLDCPAYQPNEADLVLTGDAESDFERPEGLPSVYSFADVYKTTANARASWARGVRPALAACMAKLLAETLRAEGTPVKIVSVARIAFPKLAPLTAAFRAVLRATVTESGETTTIPLTMHLVALGRGRGQAGLMTVSVGTGTPAADLRVFARLLAQRLTAAKL